MIVSEQEEKFQLMGDGLRYRRKRKFQDINNFTIDNRVQEKPEQNFQIETNPEEEKSKKSKKLKTSKNKENIDQAPIKPKEEAKNNFYIKENNLPVEIKKSEEQIIKIKEKKNDIISSSDPQSSTVSDNKKAYLKELTKAKEKVRQYEEYFTNESLPLIVQKLKACCIKNSRTLKDLKRILYLTIT